MNKQKQQKLLVNDPAIPAGKMQQAVNVYVVTVVIITLLVGAIPLVNFLNFLPGLVVNAFQVLAFLAGGMLHVSYLDNRISFPGSKLITRNSLFFSAFLFLIMSVALLLLYLFTDSNMIRMAFASSSAFLIPFVLMQAWKTYNLFPVRHYKVWYNSDVVMDSRTTVFLNSLPVRLRLSMKYFDITEEEFEITVPGHTQFGKFFNQFIIEKNKNNPSAIECVDSEKKPFGWQFYVERFGGLNKQFVDPELSLRENNVRDNSIITAKRQRAVESSIELPVDKLPVVETQTLPQLNRPKSVKKHEAGK